MMMTVVVMVVVMVAGMGYHRLKARDHILGLG
jgi:hypothetical protein